MSNMDGGQDANSKSMMQVLANLMRTQASSSGVKLTDESMAQVLVTNMQRLLKEGKLTQEQIMQACHVSAIMTFVLTRRNS
jgi:hypothetical protein